MRKFLLLSLAIFIGSALPEPALATTVTDSFTGTAGTTLDTHTSGGMTWASSSATTDLFILRSAGGVRQSLGTGASYYAATSPVPPTADYNDLASILPQAGFTNNIGVGARVQSNHCDGYWAIYQQSAGNIQLYAISATGATYTAIGSPVTFSASAGTAFTLGITVSGSTISIQLNGTTVGTSQTDTTYTTGTPGLYSYGSGSTNDTSGFAVQSLTFTYAASGGGGGGSLPTMSADAADTSWLYSPWNWVPGTYSNGTFSGRHYAAAVNPGAYIAQQNTQATSCVLYFDVTNLGSFNSNDIPHVKVRVDNGSWVNYPAAASIDVSAQLNPNTSTAQLHLLEILFNSVGTGGGQERFNVVAGTGVVAPIASLIFQGVVYNAGATWSAPPRHKYNVMLYGDSITEGVDALGNGATAGYPGIYNDAASGWAFSMRTALNAEVGIIGFSGQAVANTAYFNHTAVSTFAYVFQGAARNFASPVPDAIGFDWGTNDGGSTSANFVAGIQTIYNTIVVAAPRAKTFMWEDFRAQQTAGEVAAMAAIGGKLITGLLDGNYMTNGIADSYDGNHPTATSHATKMSPIISAGITPLLSGSRIPTYF